MNVTTVLEEKLVLFITSEKLVLFTGNCLTISHTFLALSTQWLVLLLQGNGDVESSHNFIELFCIWCEYRELGMEGKGEWLRILLCNPIGGNLLWQSHI